MPCMTLFSGKCDYNTVTLYFNVLHPLPNTDCRQMGSTGVCDSLAMASSMAMAAKVPARPWPLMKTALYFWGSLPTKPNRLPWSTAPNATEGREREGFMSSHTQRTNLLM